MATAGEGGAEEDMMDGYNDEDMDVSQMMESNLEEGDEEDYENQMVEVEPEIFLDNVNDGFDGDDDGAVMFGESSMSVPDGENSSSNQFFDDSFNDSSLGGGFASGNDNSNDDYSSSGFPRPGSSASGSRGGKTPLGPNCPICGQVLHRQHSRDHVAWHFMDELKEMIAEPGTCPDPGCEYTGDKTENICRHLALYHGKLDDFLSDQALVGEKRIKAMSKPRKVSIGSQCIICGLKDPAREHVSRHFMKELMEVVDTLGDQLNCPDCPYRGEKPQNLARHIALVHSKLDELLMDQALIEERRREFLSKPNKLSIGPQCPVCDQPLAKQHSRVHVIWHFMTDLREMVANFSDPNKCDYCDYTNASSDKIAKHIALGHSKLDELLSDAALVKKKRSMARSKPKKEEIGPCCPICGVRDPPREHVARHFGDELSAYVSTLPDQLACLECSYKGEKTKNLELHIALVHGKLDEYLKDEVLVNSKKSRFLSTPKKTIIGPQCPICDMKFTKSQNRDHVSWHFMEELREFVRSFENTTLCPYCPYTSEKVDNLVKHLALGHSKLDELLQNAELVAAKRAKALSKPKKISVGPFCPVCDTKDPTREHVSRHFSDELMVYINEFEDPCSCNECEYRGDKPKTLAIHVALVHGKLDLILSNQELVGLKRAKFLAKPKKQVIGPHCPVCDLQFTKNQNRDHVAWHYMDELRAIVDQFPDPSKCTQCPYTGDTIEKMVKHVALGHSMLDGFLQDKELLQLKRIKAMAKPKKVSVGPSCPVCDVKEPTREHIARHFSDELLDIVSEFPDQSQCTECTYRNDKPKNVAIHIALVHNILDQMLVNDNLVKGKRDKHFSTPQKVNVGAKCPVCDLAFNKGQQNRDHVCWHFMEELREIVMGFPDKEACTECSYRSDKVDNLVKHIALGHSKLDELLLNTELIQRKREIALAKPKKINIGPQCPICDLKFLKGQNRDHVSWHFMDELRDFVRSTGYEKACTLCYYTTDKLDNLVKHYALGHSKLDEYLQNEELIRAKREIAMKKPKRLSFGKDCPICGQSNRDRDHVARHFMPELMEIVNSLPKKSKCDQCDYSNSRNDYMAKHIALFHCKLDEMMLDEELVNLKKEKAKNMPKKVPMGEKCIICGTSIPSREHVARHFNNELCAIVAENSPSPMSCPECSFTAEKAEYVARHMGLVHCYLDRLVVDSELVAKKIAEHQGTIQDGAPAAANFVPTKVLPMREAVRKSQRQKEQEEREAQRQKEMEERRREEERERKRQRAAELEAKRAAVAAAAAERPAKIPKLEPGVGGSGASGSLLERTLLRTNQPGKPLVSPSTSVLTAPNRSKLHAQANAPTPESLLMKTLLKGSDNSPAAGGPTKIPTNKQQEMWSLEKPNTSGKRGSLSIKIKRTTPVKWEINSGAKPQDEYTIEPVTKEEEEDQNEQGNAQGQEVECEPDLTDLMVPLISHNMEEDDDGDGMEGVEEIGNDDDDQIEVDPTHMLLEPQVILQDEDDVAAAALNDDSNASTPTIGNSSAPRSKPRKFHSCPVCDQEFPSREHVAKHFTAELVEVVRCFPDPQCCTQCQYEADSEEEVAVHVGVCHGQMEKCLKDISLLQTKRNDAFAESLNNTGGRQRKTHAVSATAVRQPPPLRRMGGQPAAKALQKPHSPFMVSGSPSTSGASSPSPWSVTCPICDQIMSKSHSRDHIVWHFMDNLRTLLSPGNENQCPQCNYTGEKSENVARHIALFHGQLDILLQDQALVMEKRSKALSKPKKVNIGSHCPICDFKDPPREHVSRHFMPELLAHVETLSDQLHCAECNYTGEKPQNLAKHIALVHSMLDELLRDSVLVAAKREEVMSKPKKVSIGDNCPICDMAIPKRDSRVHVIWHFMEDLREIVSAFADQRTCDFCGYQNPRPDKMAKHLALGHSKLDELLMNEELVQLKREQELNKPKKLVLGPECPICGIQFTKNQNRDHVAWHFMDELRELVLTFEDPRYCNQCTYMTDKVDNLVKHIALGHSKLDELMMDEELVAQKRQLAMAKPKKVSIGPECPICGMRFSKAPNRDHVAWHFMDELREVVSSFEDTTSCNQCTYTSDKMDNLVKHIALGHCKLDELLMDEELVTKKKMQALQRQRGVKM